MFKKLVLVLGGLGALAFAAVAVANPTEPVDRGPNKPQWFRGGVYVGNDSQDPASATGNKVTAIAVRTYAHATPLVDGGTCAGAVLGIPGSVGKPGDACEIRSDAFVQSPNGLARWACDITDAGAVTVQRCNSDTTKQLDAGVGDTLHITVISHQ